MREGFFNSFDGTRIFYRENLNNFGPASSEIPVTFIHGQSGGNHTMLKSQIDYLKEHYPVLAYDLRGGGKSELKPKREDYALQNMAQDALSLLEHKKIKKTNIVSYSLGTTISLKLFELNPGIVNSLVLLHPTYNPLKTTGPLNRFIVKSGLNYIFETSIAGVASLVNALKGIRQSVYLDYTRLNISTGIGAYCNIEYLKSRTPRELMTRVQFAFARLQWDAENILDMVDVPVLCVAGGQDKWTLPSAALEIASRVKNGRCAIIPENIHPAVYTHPGKINGHILEFLKEFG